MKRFLKPFYLGVFTAFVCSFSILVSVGLKAYAISYQGPDTSEYGGANIYYELSNTSNVTSTSMTIPFYYATRPSSASGVTVTCGDGAGNVKVEYLPPGGGAAVLIDGILCNGNFSIPVAAFPATEDANTGYFKAKIVLSLTDPATKDSNYKAFKFDIINTAKIGYSAGNSSRFATANLNRCDPGGDNSGCNKYFNYKLPFAPPCSLASGSRTITLLDPDNPKGSDKYGIQPNAFSVKLVESNKAGTITNASVNIPRVRHNVGDPNNEYWTYDFNYRQGYNYQLELGGVYANNVIQFQVPFDSINFDAPCLVGGITSTGFANCSAISGYIYDKYDHSPIIRYYIAINPAVGDPQNSYSSSAALGSDLDIWTYGDANDPTPKADTNGNGIPDLAGHGFNVNTPPKGYGTQHRYAGPWQPNTYVIYGRELGTNTVRKIRTLNVGVCATKTCNSSDTNFAPTTVNSPDNFVVWMTTNSYADSPPPAATFTVKITNPAGTTYTVSPSATYASSKITSSNISYTPTQSGSYNISWTYYGQTCSTSHQAGYAPYFSVLGGDIAAGAGFGNGSCSETPNAEIKSWNTNTGTYDGAGTQIGALATGDITDFVSGLGLSGGANAGALNLKGHGLSFANDSPPSPPSYGGQFTGGGLACVHDYAGDVATSGATPLSGAIDSIVSGSYTSGAVTLGDPLHNDLIISAGKTITLYVTGDVYITSNIKYGGYTLATVPRFNLYVIGGNVYIDPNVTELHGVYVAQKTLSGTGVIKTCAPFSIETQDNAVCNIKNTPLKFVGAVAADAINLDRTHGSLIADPAATPAIPAEPAEIFQYSPELWLSASPVPSLKYQAFTSLPPVL